MSKRDRKSTYYHLHKRMNENDIVNNPRAPVRTDAQIKRLYNDTQIGSPVDTVEEIDAQEHNLGPKDTQIENSAIGSEPEVNRRKTSQDNDNDGQEPDPAPTQIRP